MGAISSSSSFSSSFIPALYRTTRKSFSATTAARGRSTLPWTTKESISPRRSTISTARLLGSSFQLRHHHFHHCANRNRIPNHILKRTSTVPISSTSSSHRMSLGSITNGGVGGGGVGGGGGGGGVLSYKSISSAMFASTKATTPAPTSSTSKYSSKKEQEEKIIQNVLYRIRQVNDVPDDVQSKLMYFMVDNKILGKVTPQTAELLCQTIPPSTGKPIFEMVQDDPHFDRMILTLTESAGLTCQSRTDSVMSIMSQLHSEGVITGWRDELYPATDSFYNTEPTFLVERAAAPFLGTMEYGVHINGFVREDDGTTKMWMARRSSTKSKYPGMLDHIVAGGQPAGIGLMDNVIKECMEEAGISEDLTRAGIQAAGAISYETYGRANGLICRAVMFCYDLELPLDFTPKIVDGEVEEFFLWTIDEVLESMDPEYHDPIKPNCYPVIIDYLLRHGYLSPETTGYLDVLRELRSGYCG